MITINSPIISRLSPEMRKQAKDRARRLPGQPPKTALDNYRADPHSFAQRLQDASLRLSEKPTGVARLRPGAGGGPDEGEEANARVADENKEEEACWDDALDIKYMSSEDEANVHDFKNPVAIGTDKPDNTLASAGKVFAICRPTWRSKQVQNLFSILDTVKHPEPVYRRVMDPVRQTRPPEGTLVDGQ